MKRISLLLAISFALITCASAQNSDLNKWINKTQGKSTVVNQQNKVQTNSQLSNYSLLMEKSTKFQYGALACATIGTGLSIAGALVGTKSYYEDPKNPTPEEIEKAGDQGESDRKLRRGLFVGAGVSFAAALCLEWAALDYKFKAGRSLKLYANGTGGGLAYTF